jgi:hypothetical protein
VSADLIDGDQWTYVGTVRLPVGGSPKKARLTFSERHPELRGAPERVRIDHICARDGRTALRFWVRGAAPEPPRPDSPREKRPFLVVYDYGMGGLWGVVDALAEAQITAKCPERMIVGERPTWMSPERFQRLCERRRYDIEDEPRGILRARIAGRPGDT